MGGRWDCVNPVENVGYILMETTGSSEAIGDRARKQFGEAVREQRTKRGMTQDALGKRLTSLGVSASQTTVAKIERGDRPTPIDEAAVLAHIFEVPLSALVPTDSVSRNLAMLADIDADVKEAMDRYTSLWSEYTEGIQRRRMAAEHLRRLFERRNAFIDKLQAGSDAGKYESLGVDLHAEQERKLMASVDRMQAAEERAHELMENQPGSEAVGGDDVEHQEKT